MKFILTFSILLTLIVVNVTQAQEPQIQNDTVSVFKDMKIVSSPEIIVPTLVSLPVEKDVVDGGVIALYETSSGLFIPYRIDNTYTTAPAYVTADSQNPNDSKLTDGKSETGVTYEVNESRDNVASIALSHYQPITSTSLTLELDRHVALPQFVRITSVQDGVQKVVVSRTPMRSTQVFFPETTSSEWIVELTYAQPLRINEISFSQDNVEKTVKRNIVFLAQPNSPYVLYFNAERFVDIDTIESGNLYGTEGLLTLPVYSSQSNPEYRESDIDNDNIPDLRDNCVNVYNTDQIDLDDNGRGDVCDDYDRDGVMQSKDNCPNIANTRQQDEDGDGIGDACDDEESRFTEKYTWVPWAGMGIAVLVIIVLFTLVATAPKKPEDDDLESEDSKD